MTHTLDEIKKMLKEITVWPVMEVGAGPIIIDCHEIISELVEEVEYWQKRHADLSDSKTNEYHSGYKDRYDEAKHGAEGRYSLVKELREQIQTLRDKNDA